MIQTEKCMISYVACIDDIFHLNLTYFIVTTQLMELYQMLDAMIEIEGDVRYFLCGLDNEQNERTGSRCIL